ncbi:class I SAM-dependent methyltransferase [Thermodesulfobacteriota bacterium]
MNEHKQKRYPDDHWIRSYDTQKSLEAYLEQQSKAYSRVKNAYVRELLGDLGGKRFLDYGCGGGLFTVYAANSGAAQVVGVDAEESVLRTARLYARTEGVENLCQLIPSPTFPSFPPRTRFDVILMKDVIEHLEDDQALLNAAAEAIAPGGIIVISTQNSFSLNFLIEGSYHRGLKGNKEWCGWDPTHVRFYTYFSLKNKLDRAGFTSTAWRSVYLIPYKLPALPGMGTQFLRIDPLSLLDRTIGWFFPFNLLGWNIIVKAQAGGEVPEPVKRVRYKNNNVPQTV